MRSVFWLFSDFFFHVETLILLHTVLTMVQAKLIDSLISSRCMDLKLVACYN